MIKLQVIGVLYNNLEDLNGFLDSLSKSVDTNESKIITSVSVVNNGMKVDNNLILKHDSIEVSVFEGHGNVGYFPGLSIAHSKLSSNSYDICVICNFDLKVDLNFIKELIDSYNENESQCIVAPTINSLSEGKNRNPKMVARPSKKAMMKYKILYTIPYFHYFYSRTLYKLKSTRKVCSHLEHEKIYAPHGSFVIFFNCFDFLNELLRYPIFMFGEEIYIGELARDLGINCYYNKNIIIEDRDHGSTGLQNEKFIRNNNLLAIDYLLDLYWK